MQNKKKLHLVLCLVALLVISTLCLSACTQKNTGSAITFEGIQEIHAPAGTVTEESLLAGVTATDAEGKSKDVTIDLGGADLSKPGQYVIEYKCGDVVERENVYIYGDMTYQVNGQNLEGQAVEIPFATATTSLNFTKIVSVVDSFGNPVEVSKVEGDMFDYLTGDYTVKFIATDKAGQTLEKTITFTVTSQVEITVESNVSVKYEQDSVKFKVDLDGETDLWLMAGNTLVSVGEYTVADNGLELYSSYFRTLPVGENTLKLCAVNGSTEFTFTVVDTGKPLFTFDSIYKSNIISGNPVVYAMPKSQVAGHEYSYTFKVTKDGVTYKAEQKGNGLLITTSAGKNLTPGVYDITVTATNKADTSKKTTFKGDFRIYTNQKEIDGWVFGNDGNGSLLQNVDLSKYGYYRTSWNYVASTPNSWKSRLYWMDTMRETFQYITFDFYVYSLGIAEKENSAVKYVGKNDLASIPFSASTMSGQHSAYMFYDKNGNVVELDELKMNTWYTVKLDTSEISNAPEESTALAWYFGQSNKWQASMYITEMHFWAYEGSGTQYVFKDNANTVSMERNGGKSNLVSGNLDGESVINYTVAKKHIPGTAITRALKLTLKDASKEVISIDFKYLEEVKDVSGNLRIPFMYVQDKDDTRAGVFGASYTVVDAETGIPCATPEVGKWYTLYITTNGSKNFLICPMGKDDVQLTCKLAFKNLQTHDVKVGNTVIINNSGNIAPIGLAKDNDGQWSYSYASHTGWDATENTAYYRRVTAKLDGSKYTELHFRIRFTVSDFKAADATDFVKDLRIVADGLNLVIMDEFGQEVAPENRVIGQWYYGCITTGDGYPLPDKFDLYPQGYNNGGASSNQIVNVELQIADLLATEPDTSPVTVFEADVKNQVTLKRTVVDGKNVYTYSTIGVPAPANEGWARRQGLQVAEGTTHMAVTFRYTEAFGADGVTPITPTMSFWQSDLTSGAPTKIYNAATGELVSADNGNNTALTVGTWYTAVVATGGATTFYMYPCNDSAEAVQITLEIADRAVYNEANAFASFATPWDAFADPAPVYVDGQWIDAIHSSAAEATQEEKQLAVTVSREGIKKLSFQMLMTNGSGSAHAHFLSDSSNVKIYNAAGAAVEGSALQNDVWYTFVYTNGENIGTEQITLGYLGEGAGGLDVYIKNVDIGAVAVSFDLNYKGAVNNLEGLAVLPNDPYGTLPVPDERANYSFGGWYLNAKCTGDAVTAETVMTATQNHSLYAKWVKDPGPAIMVQDPSVLSVAGITQKKQAGIAAGQKMYIYTKRGGIAADSADNKVPAAIWFSNEDGYDYISFDFYYAAFSDRNGVYMCVEASGSSKRADTYMVSDLDLHITYTDTGKAVATTLKDGGTWFTVDSGRWQTVTCKVKDWPKLHMTLFQATDAVVYITNVQGSKSLKSTVNFDLNYEGADNNLTAKNVTQHTAYGELAAPEREGFTFGGWFLNKEGVGTAVTAETLVNAIVDHTLYAKWVDPNAEPDEPDVPDVPDEPEDTTLVARNPAYLSVATPDELAAVGITDATGTVYRFTKGVGSADINNGDYALWLENRNGNAYVTFDVRYSAATGKNPYLLLVARIEGGHTDYLTTSDGITFVKKGTDISAEESDGAYNWIDLNTWYTVTIPMTDRAEIYLGWDTSDTAEVFITNIVWSDEIPEPGEPDVPDEPAESTLVARNPAYLSVATPDELAAVGITDATGTVYHFTKGVGSADINSGDYGLWLENRNNNAYVTFDVRYSEAAGKNPYLLLVARIEGGDTDYLTTSDGIIFVKKGTDISAEESDGAYNWIDLNTWYTVTIPMTDRAEIYLGWDTSDTAEVFITNIVWSDEIPEPGEPDVPDVPDEPEDTTLVARNPAYLSEATPDELAAVGITDATGTVYRFTKGVGSADINNGDYALWLENRNNNAYVTFDVRYSEAAGKNPNLLLITRIEGGSTDYLTTSDGIIFVKKGTDISAEESDGAYNWIDLNTWYTVTVPMTDRAEIYLSWDTGDTATMFVTNIVWSDEIPGPGEPDVPDEPEDTTLVARNPAYLSEATPDELAAVGITDATGTVYRFTKGVGSADMNNGDYALWLENRNGNAYVTFDVRYSEAAGKNPYLLVVTKTGEYRTPGNSGITFVKKGTDISATESDGAYNWIELNTWYTVTVPMAALSEIYLGWDTNDSATVFITNIVWTAPVAPEEVGIVATGSLSVATREELNAAGIKDAGTTYLFNRVASGVDKLYLENQSNNLYVTFDVQYSAFNFISEAGQSGRAYLLLTPNNGGTWLTTGSNGVTIVKKGTDTAAEVFSGAYNLLELNTWYTVTVPVQDVSQLQVVFNMADSATMLITNVAWVAPVAPEEVGLVARNPSYLGVAGASDLTAAGITDATGTVYRFTKGVGSADVNNGDYALWLENRNGNAYVTFDVRYSTAAGKNPYLLVVSQDGAEYFTPSDGITFVQKGTTTSVEESDGAYNWISLNTWYTVTVPMAEASKVFLAMDTNDSATMFIANIVWSD